MILEDESWLLFRGSGTEPMLRVYSEATSHEKLEQLLGFGREFVRNNLK
jgi:phosphomannomutase